MTRGAWWIVLLALVPPGVHALEVPTLTRRVTDQARVLGGDVERLEQKLLAYEQATGHQFAVLTVDTLDGEVLEQYAIKVAEAWRLGDARRDDGLLLLLAMKERQLRVEVGYGLEGAVTDAQAARVIRDVMVPQLQAGSPARAVDAGLDALMALAKGEAVGAAPPAVRRLQDALRGVGNVVLLLLALVLYFLGWKLRAALGAVVGAVWGAVAFHSVGAFLVGLVGGALLGIVLPYLRGGHHHGGRSGGGGGFGGGGGGFGGGGASGRW
jgi:uncharacterized protein